MADDTQNQQADEPIDEGEESPSEEDAGPSEESTPPPETETSASAVSPSDQAALDYHALMAAATNKDSPLPASQRLATAALVHSAAQDLDKNGEFSPTTAAQLRAMRTKLDTPDTANIVQQSTAATSPATASADTVAKTPAPPPTAAAGADQSAGIVGRPIVSTTTKSGGVETTTPILDKATVAKYNQSLNDYSDAMGNLAQIEQSKVQAQLPLIQESAAKSQAMAQDMEAERVRRQAQIDEQQAKVRAAVDKFSSMKIDSNRFWNDQGTGGRILGAISMGLGAYGAAMTGSKNFAMEIVDNAINRDIDAQKANANIARESVETQRGVYGDMLNSLKDDQAARIATRQVYLEAVQQRLVSTAAMIGAGVPPGTTDLKDIDWSKVPPEKQQIAQNLKAMMADTQLKHAQDFLTLSKGLARSIPTETTTTQQTYYGKPASADIVARREKLDAAQAKINDLRQLLQSGQTKTGPIAGAATLAAQQAGITGPLSEIHSKLMDLNSDIATDFGRTRRVIPAKQLDAMIKSRNMGTILMSPEHLLKKLDDAQQLHDQESSALERESAAQGFFPGAGETGGQQTPPPVKFKSTTGGRGRTK